MKHCRKVYHLESTDGKHYVGRSSHLRVRLARHFRGQASRWTEQHRPVRVVSVRKERSCGHEREATLALMAKYGVDSVRGGPWCQRVLQPRTRAALEKRVGALRQKKWACIRAARARKANKHKELRKH
mmetsp:Transcript_5799/g.17758  ORF Transcript_5799/g.17758 Transcript_5799/m.17758 type:complete len:128 (-) Transcript_5799:335-718(-)